MESVNIAIIGAGVIGLAIAEGLSKDYQDILVIEKNPSFGQETSSRNSEVIHAGIYYPQDSLKAATCREGRDLLYQFCRQNNIPHKKISKIIVAIDSNEIEDLEKLWKNGLANAVRDLKFLSRQEIKKLEPYAEAEAGIYSPSTGIIDSHSFMQALLDRFTAGGGLVVYNTELVGIDKNKDSFLLTVEDKNEDSFKFSARILINSAGLNADKVSAMAGLRKEEYRIKFCKGDYFRVHNNKAKFINRLIYPLPKEGRAGLGIHATLDLGGSLRLGPDDEYVEKIDYNIDAAKQKNFYESIRQSLPFIELGDLMPDISGIRPKLAGPREGFRDFIIQDEASSGLSGLINLIGIESPGLTSSLSIAKMIKQTVKYSLS